MLQRARCWQENWVVHERSITNWYGSNIKVEGWSSGAVCKRRGCARSMTTYRQYRWMDPMKTMWSSWKHIRKIERFARKDCICFWTKWFGSRMLSLVCGMHQIWVGVKQGLSWRNLVRGFYLIYCGFWTRLRSREWKGCQLTTIFLWEMTFEHSTTTVLLLYTRRTAAESWRYIIMNDLEHLLVTLRSVLSASRKPHVYFKSIFCALYYFTFQTFLDDEELQEVGK